MKTIRSLAILALWASSMEARCQSPQGFAVVKRITGSAKYSQGDDAWKPLKKGDELTEGAIVQSGAGSVVYVYLGANGPSLRLIDETRLVLERLTHVGEGTNVVIDTRLDLRYGEILGSVRKLNTASHYEVKTPTGLARASGCDYDITTRTNARGKFESTYLSVSGVLSVTDTNSVTNPAGFPDGGKLFDVTGVKPPQSQEMVAPRVSPLPPQPPVVVGSDWVIPVPLRPLQRPPPHH